MKNGHPAVIVFLSHHLCTHTDTLITADEIIRKSTAFDTAGYQYSVTLPNPSLPRALLPTCISCLCSLCARQGSSYVLSCMDSDEVLA